MRSVIERAHPDRRIPLSREAYRRHRDPLSGSELLWAAIVCIGLGVGLLVVVFVARGWL
jgi:hypothetical protein